MMNEPLDNSPTSLVMSRLIFWAVSTLIILALVAVAIPNFVKARTTRAKSACIGNLRQIEGAKGQWSLEHKHTNGALVLEVEVNQYLKGGKTPACPAGGSYSYNRVGVAPTCSMAGSMGASHSLSLGE